MVSCSWKQYIEENKKSTNTNFYKEYFVKINYKSQRYIIFTIKFWDKFNRAEFYGKFFRLSMLDDTEFNINDILNFIKDSFSNIEIKKLELALDISTENKIFLENLYDYLIKEKNLKEWNVWNYKNWPTFESINIWNINEKDNSYYYFRIYDKKIEVNKHEKELKYLYLNYFNKTDEIIRFEISMRKDITKNVLFDDLYFINDNNDKLFNILLTYFIKKGVDIFDISYKKILIKSIDNSIKWSLETKVKKSDSLRKMKMANTIIKNIEDEIWEDRIEILKNLDPIIQSCENYDEYVVLYEQLFENIFLLYEDWDIEKIKYNDLFNIINWWLDYISDFLEISVDEFLDKIKWYVNNNIVWVFSLFSENIIKIIYIYYHTKQFHDEKMFKFLKIIDDSNIKYFEDNFDEKFSQKYLSKLKKRINYISNEKEVNSKDLFSIILKEYD